MLIAEYYMYKKLFIRSG